MLIAFFRFLSDAACETTDRVHALQDEEGLEHSGLICRPACHLPVSWELNLKPQSWPRANTWEVTTLGTQMCFIENKVNESLFFKVTDIKQLYKQIFRILSVSVFPPPMPYLRTIKSWSLLYFQPIWLYSGFSFSCSMHCKRFIHVYKSSHMQHVFNGVHRNKIGLFLCQWCIFLNNQINKVYKSLFFSIKYFKDTICIWL